MEIDESPLGNSIVLRPIGRLDNATSLEFQERLLRAAADADVIVDFSDVEYISSGGLRALMMAAKQKTDQRRIAVAALRASVQDIFVIAHFEQVLPVFATVEAVRRNWAWPRRRDDRQS